MRSSNSANDAINYGWRFFFGGGPHFPPLPMPNSLPLPCVRSCDNTHAPTPLFLEGGEEEEEEKEKRGGIEPNFPSLCGLAAEHTHSRSNKRETGRGGSVLPLLRARNFSWLSLLIFCFFSATLFARFVRDDETEGTGSGKKKNCTSR